MSKDVWKVGVAVLALGASGVLLARWYFQDSGPKREITYLICSNSKCKNEFNVPYETYKQAVLDRSSVPCPKCSNKDTIEGFHCESCGRVCPPHGHGTPPVECTYCKKPLILPPKRS